MVMFPVVALILSLLFEGLQLNASIVAGTVLVLAGNVFVLERGNGQPVRNLPVLDDVQPTS